MTPALRQALDRLALSIGRRCVAEKFADACRIGCATNRLYGGGGRAPLYLSGSA